MVNTKRGVAELMEASMGDDFSDADLLIFHSSIGHNFQEILDQAKEMAPNARILAASCCAVVGKEGVSESMKDIALMAIKGTEFKIASTDSIFGHNSQEKAREMAASLKLQCEAINMIYFLASGIDIDDDACIRGIEEVFGSEVTIFGATSADNMK
jgi:hypothetical protein